VLHGKELSTARKMAKVNGELGGRGPVAPKEATQQILEAAEAIDNGGDPRWSKVNTPDQQKAAQRGKSRETRRFPSSKPAISRILTGQRISKVMTTMKFIEKPLSSS